MTEQDAEQREFDTYEYACLDPESMTSGTLFIYILNEIITTCMYHEYKSNLNLSKLQEQIQGDISSDINIRADLACKSLKLPRS